MNIEDEVYEFISTHEAIVSRDVREKSGINANFTSFGNKASRKALMEVIELLDEDTKSKVVEMMKSKRVKPL